jgi:hypothetical protein
MPAAIDPMAPKKPPIPDEDAADSAALGSRDRTAAARSGERRGPGLWCGTSSQWTPRWRKTDSNSRSRVNGPRFEPEEWSRGTPADWAMEAFALARDDAYELLPQPGDREGSGQACPQFHPLC